MYDLMCYLWIHRQFIPFEWVHCTAMPYIITLHGTDRPGLMHTYNYQPPLTFSIASDLLFIIRICFRLNHTYQIRRHSNCFNFHQNWHWIKSDGLVLKQWRSGIQLETIRQFSIEMGNIPSFNRQDKRFAMKMWKRLNTSN